MIREALSNYPYAALSAFALLIFLGIFLGMLTWVFRKGSREAYQRIAELPLNEQIESFSRR